MNSLRLPSDLTEPKILSISTLVTQPDGSTAVTWVLASPALETVSAAFRPLAQSQPEGQQTCGHSPSSPLPVSPAMTSSPRPHTETHPSQEQVCELGGGMAENHCGQIGAWCCRYGPTRGHDALSQPVAAWSRP